jgi:hypothetical protein
MIITVDLLGSGNLLDMNQIGKNPKDVTITGFTDQILNFIGQRQTAQLSYVEKIDVLKGIDKEKKAALLKAMGGIKIGGNAEKIGGNVEIVGGYGETPKPNVEIGEKVEEKIGGKVEEKKAEEKIGGKMEEKIGEKKEAKKEEELEIKDDEASNEKGANKKQLQYDDEEVPDQFICSIVSFLSFTIMLK